MGCNCGKKTATSFVVNLPNGQTMVVNSAAQARAEITRAGGGTYRAQK